MWLTLDDCSIALPGDALPEATTLRELREIELHELLARRSWLSQRPYTEGRYLAGDASLFVACDVLSFLACDWNISLVTVPFWVT